MRVSYPSHRRRWALVTLVGFVCACTLKAESPTTASPQAVAIAPGDPSRPLSSRTQILLIAGGTDVANFAEEVVAQRRHWHALGYTDDQIACYWARPAAEAYEADLEQYQRLLPDISGCYPARSGLLIAHLRQLAANPPPWLYIYITSHGRTTMLPEGITPNTLNPDETRLLDQHFIQMGSDPGEGSDPRAVIEGYRNGVPEASLMLTPTNLADALRAFPARTAKYVMLQACHGGGFISIDDPEDRVPRLLGVANLVAIAAARHDRPSFGCEPGSTMTYFGEIFFRLLSEQFPAPPDAVDWEKLYEQLWQQVEALERQQGVPASMPVLAISG